MADSYNFLSLYTILYIILYAAGHIMIKRRNKQSRLVTGSKKPDVILDMLPSGEVRRERGSSETVHPNPPSS